MNKDNFYLKNYKIIIAIVMLINYVMLALIGSGVLENVSSRFFEIYFFLSFTFLPIIFIFAYLYTRFKKEEDINLKDYSLYLPFIQSALFILLFAIKYCIQLDRKFLGMFIVIAITFFLVNGILILFIKKDISKKKYVIVNIFSYLTMLAYILLMIIMSYDYSVLL